MKGHMANINRLAKEGKLIVAGPFDGGGVFILNTTSTDEARLWLNTDPGVQATDGTLKFSHTHRALELYVLPRSRMKWLATIFSGS